LGELSWIAIKEYYELAKRYLQKGKWFSDLWLKGGFEAAKKVADDTKLFSLLANIDTKSLIIHPASTTHQQLSDEQQLTSGVSKDLIVFQ
jgi:O-acetylhomoserine (thiol)-lyase